MGRYVQRDMAALPNKLIGGAVCWTPQSLANAHCLSAVRCKTWTQSECYTWQNSVRGKSPKNVYSVPAQETVKHRAKFGCPLLSSNEAKRRNPLKFSGVPQTHQSIPAASGPKFTTLWGHMEDISLFNHFFRLSIHALVAKI